MKGNNVEEEIKESKNAIKILGTKMLPVEKVVLPDTEITRNIITVEKIKILQQNIQEKLEHLQKNLYKRFFCII